MTNSKARTGKLLYVVGMLTVLWCFARFLSKGAPIFRLFFGFRPADASTDDAQTAVTARLRIAGARAKAASIEEAQARSGLLETKDANLWLWVVWLRAKSRFASAYRHFGTLCNLATAYGFKADHKLPDVVK